VGVFGGSDDRLLSLLRPPRKMKLLVLFIATVQADLLNSLFHIPKAASAAAPRAGIDQCGDATDCTSCLSASHDKGGFCGWCPAQPVVYADGTIGKQCADFRDNTTHCDPTTGKCGWQCSGQTETGQCILGWICGGNETGYQCIRAATPGSGTPSYNDCQAGCVPRPSFKCSDPTTGTCSACASPTDPNCTHDYSKCNEGCQAAKTYQCNTTAGTCMPCPAGTPPSQCVSGPDCLSTCKAKTVKYECDIPTDVTQEPQCKPCTDPSSSACRFAAEADCNKTCVWTYKCDVNATGGPKCSKDPSGHGIPAAPGKDPSLWCDQQCTKDVTYTCDQRAKTCNATGTGGGGQNKTQCEANCPTKPQPTPPAEMLGVWRGLEIHNGFQRGEWTMNVSATNVVIYEPAMKIYASGNASHLPIQGGPSGETGELWISSTAGKLVGTVKMIYGDANLEPELAYIALGVSETQPGTPITDYDTGMVTATDKVLGMMRCKDDINCHWHLPPTPPSPLLSMIYMPPTPAPKAFESADACNQYLSCDDCIGKSVAGGNVCGWCSTPVHYLNGSQPTGPHQCAGHRQSVSTGWTCYGTFRTISCSDFVCDPVIKQCTKATTPSGPGHYPTKDACDKACGGGPSPPPYQPCVDFNGVYRGIQIDLNYGKGEWDATFSQTSTTPPQTTATFEFVPTSYTYSGTMTCQTGKTQGEGDFKLKLTNGTTLYGLYDTKGGAQPETQGLTLAFSNIGMVVPPTDFRSAMPGLNASVYGYTKCADYKKGVCKF
jgi:hypothetical protein